jgi:transposase
MRSKSGPQSSAERHVREIRRQTRKQYSSEDKIRIVLVGLRGEYFIAELCWREGIAQGLYYIYGQLSRCKSIS